jgi:class 3 adenylate cyclase/predicted ATPase
MICAACGQENRPEARFCDTCGARLGLAPVRDGPAPERAERRQLSVVFCDLVGSTALSRSIDPEELREIIGRYQEAATAAVRALGGHTAIFLGDGILTYFGYPDAHEDDPERAVRAGLDIVRAVRHLNREAEGPRLAVRVAVHTGEVVVGDLDVAGAGIFGDTPNVAARLQDVAPHDGVVVSEATHRLTRGLFRVTDMGEYSLAGVDRPMRTYLILGPSGVRSRFARSDLPRGPLVGRDREAEVLWEAWDEARSRSGRAVLIRGEAGIGKSRLVGAFHDRVADTVHTWLECAGTPYTRHSAFAAVIELQRTALRFAPEHGDADRLRLIEAAVARADMNVMEAVPILARLHSITIPAASEYAGALAGLGPDQIRRRTKEVALEWLLRIGHQQAVVLLVEDLHWLDPSTVELLGEILARVQETTALLIMTARPEFEAEWSSERLLTLPLAGLEADAAAALVRGVDGAGSLAAADVQAIVERTDGVPLFVEEMARAAVERGGAGGDGPADGGVPATLKGLLMARIDRLGPAREVAQVGAIIGREFGVDLLEAVWDENRGDLGGALDRIAADDLATRTGSGSQARYVFRHALIQEAAYESLLKATRRTYHARIGDALTERFPAIAETRPELVAHHFGQAQRWDRAIPLWARAGQRASERSENVEAGRHLRAGLECVEHLPAGVERLQQELLFRTQLGANLVAVRGYGAPEVAENIARARALCQQIGPSPLLFPVLYNVWVFHLVRAEAATPRLARDLLTLAEETDPGRFLTWAHVASSISAYWAGDWAAAREHAEASRLHYRHDPGTLSLFGDDPGAYGFLYQGLPLWFEGRVESAAALMDRALETAEEIGYAFTSTGIRAFRAQIGHLRRRPDLAGPEAEATVTVSMAQGFPLFLGTGLAHAGWVAIQEGRLDEGAAQVEQGVALYRSTGARLNLHYLQALVAEAELARGNASAGLAAVEEGLKLTNEQFDRICLPELHRLRGEALLSSGAGEDGVVAAFREALHSAAAMGSRMLELRAAVSWHDFARGTGAGGEAEGRLRSVLASLAEGHDEPDLEAARRSLAGGFPPGR